MKRVILIYGIISGVIISVFMVISVRLMSNNVNFDNGEIYGYTSMLVALSMVFFGIKSYRDKESGGSIKFGRAFLLGLAITTITGLLYTGSWMIYSSTIGTDFEEKYAACMEKKMRAEGKTDEEMKKYKEEMQHWMENYKNPAVKAGITFMEIFPVGFIVSLVSAFILKRKPVEAV